MILLDVIDSEFGIIQVLQRRLSGSLMYQQGGCQQSEADLNGTSLASYIHAIYGLISQRRALNVLIIGCGGGTLATMLARSSHKVTMIDINPASFALARKYFNLPVAVACHVSDGQSFLRRFGTLYDTIVVDAYNGDCIPAHLRSLEFFHLVGQRLSADGSVFANVHLHGDADRHADQIAVCMENVWQDVRILDAMGAPDRNAIVMAGAVRQLSAPSMIVPPAIDAPLMEQELLAMRFRPYNAALLDE